MKLKLAISLCIVTVLVSGKKKVAPLEITLKNRNYFVGAIDRCICSGHAEQLIQTYKQNKMDSLLQLVAERVIIFLENPVEICAEQSEFSDEITPQEKKQYLERLVYLLNNDDDEMLEPRHDPLSPMRKRRPSREMGEITLVIPQSFEHGYHTTGIDEQTLPNEVLSTDGSLPTIEWDHEIACTSEPALQEQEIPTLEQEIEPTKKRCCSIQ